MTVKDKVWFFLITLVYTLMLGLLTGNIGDQTYQLWMKRPVIVNLRFESYQFQTAALVGGVAALVLQIWRIGRSLRRSRQPYKLTLSEFFLGTQWNLQMKCLCILIAVWGVAEIRYCNW